MMGMSFRSVGTPLDRQLPILAFWKNSESNRPMALVFYASEATE